MKKFILFLICAFLAFCMLLCACNLGHIEDTNGESDTSLCSITDEDIFKNYGSFIEIGAVSSQINNKFSYHANKLSGVKALANFTAEGSTLYITFSATLYKGNLRIVLLCDGEYVQDFKIAQNQVVNIENPNGRYTVKVAGESAKVETNLFYEVI